MAYVNVAEWKPEQVTEWLKGLDNAVLPYIHSFLNNEVSGKQLLNLRPDDLDHLGVHKLGHQELILEAVEHLCNFHYELDRENLQLLGLRLSCRAHSLHNELVRETDSKPVSTQTLADVANVITAVKPLVCWLDRSPFKGQLEYHDRKCELLKLSLAIATCAQRDRFAERPVEEIRTSCKQLAILADSIIQDMVDPLILQPASLDLATLKKRAGDNLGFFIVPSFHGVHQIGEIKFSSPAHQCGKIEEGDEVVQVNYQTVVGWQTKRVMALFEESPTDIFLTLKKRPRHTKVYGQIYMKPYRLPSKKRAAPYSRWHDNLPSPRPELLTIPDFEMPLPRNPAKQHTKNEHTELECEPLASNSSSDDDDDDDSFLPGAQDEGQTSPTSMRLYLPKPRVTVQRRATVTGASPTNKRPPVNMEQFWRELRLERQWKDTGGGSTGTGERKETLYQLRDKSASLGNDLSCTVRPTTCLGLSQTIANTSQGKQIKILETSAEDHTCNGGTAHSSSSENSEKLSIKGNSLVLHGEVPNREIPMIFHNREDSDGCAKERGKLDKSHSTPAYDLSLELDQQQLIAKSKAFEKEKSVLEEDEQAQKAGEILGTINVALLQHQMKENRINNHKETDGNAKQASEEEDASCRDIPLPDPPPSQEEDSNDEDQSEVAETKEIKKEIIQEVKICVTPPEPPPRPSLKSLGRKVGLPAGSGHATFPSPRSVRKRNALLARKRNVSVRELGVGDCEGWLLHRCRSGGVGAVWLRGWFVLKGAAFYGFKTRQATKADIMISLPGFTASLAEEVRSRKYAFKIYHTGTAFYFAVEAEEELSTWLDCITLATLKQEFTKSGHTVDAVFFSETDEESEAEAEAGTEVTETCLPSPKVRKFPGFLNSSSQQDKCASQSQQNLSSDEKNTEAQKKFGSLRKLGKKDAANANSSQDPAMVVASLDRKYLRFLGGNRNNIVPVPTAHFRSYRRVPISPATKSGGNSSTSSGADVYEQKLECSTSVRRQPSELKKNDTSATSFEASKSNTRKSQETYKAAESESASQTATRTGQSGFVRSNSRPVKPQPVKLWRMASTERQVIHSSNPSLQLPGDMADYRLAAERLREFGVVRRTRQREDTTGFVTLEEFMLSRQEEERRQNQLMHGTCSTGGGSNGSSYSNSHNINYAQPGHSENAANIRATNKSSQSNKPRNGTSKKCSPAVSKIKCEEFIEYRGGSPEKLWINSLRRSESTVPKKPGRSSVTGRLKSAAQYQPPPVSQGSSSRSIHPASDDAPKMRFAFEMHLGDNSANLVEPKSGSKLRNLFLSSKAASKLDTEVQGPRTILGSPRLHRAIFRDHHPHHKGSLNSDSGSGSSIASPLSPPASSTALCAWNAEDAESGTLHFKPTMGVSMIGKKPVSGRSPGASLPYSPPDYPGLEYPPVFEPETYTLSDASALLRSRQQQQQQQHHSNSSQPNIKQN